MLFLGDRNFAIAELIARIATTGAQLLIRAKNGRVLPVLARLPDGSWLSRLGGIEIRVIDAEITAALRNHQQHHQRTGRYRLATTPDRSPPLPGPRDRQALSPTAGDRDRVPGDETTLLGGRDLRARTPTGVEQEIYALLLGYQAIRPAIADAFVGQDIPAGSRRVHRRVACRRVVILTGLTTSQDPYLPGIGTNPAPRDHRR